MLVSAPTEAVFTFIEAHAEEFSADAICGVFGVSRSGYYAWRTRPESARDIDDAELGAEIEQIHAEKHRRYGTVRIWQELHKRGRRCSKKRVARLMRERGLKLRRRRSGCAPPIQDMRCR